MPTAPDQRGSNRNFFRLAVNLPIELDVEGTPAPLEATLVDISEGGCKVASKSMMLKDTVLAFELPRRGRDPLKLRGKVRHIDFKVTTRTFDYGLEYVGLRAADADAIYQFVVEEQRRKLQTKDGEPLSRAAKAQDRQAVLRVERKFPIQYAIFGQRGMTPAMALDISRGGMRIVLDRNVPEERTLELRFTLPADVLDVLTQREHSRNESIFGREITIHEKKARPFAELRVQVKLLPGWHEIKGAHHYSVAFLRPKPDFMEEVERFLHAAQLTEIKAKRPAQRVPHR